MADKQSGLHPADQWKPGNHHGAFDWSGYDAEDLPDEVRRQMHAESIHGTQGPDTVTAAKQEAWASQQPAAKSAVQGKTSFQEMMMKRRKSK